MATSDTRRHGMRWLALQLPNSLRVELQYFLHKDTISCSEMMKGMDQAVSVMLMKSMHSSMYSIGDWIVLENDVLRHTLILSHGSLKMTVHSKPAMLISRPMSFAERALLSDFPSPWGLTSFTISELLVLQRSDFQTVHTALPIEPCPHLRRDCARPCHICTGTGPSCPTSP